MLADLLRFVRAQSPFYQDLYQHLPPDVHSTTDLPVLNQEAFWAANGLTDNRLLTGPLRDGLVLKSGGTTGKPKFSVFTRDEWTEFTKAFAAGIALNGVVEGDRVANLFYVGELYGSFLFTHRVFEECPTRVLQLPVAGATQVADACKILRDFAATVLAGLPTTILSLLDYLEAHPDVASKLKLRMVLFAGEAMYEGQRARLRRTFPNLEIRSIGYASTDAGYIGYADGGCMANEFRCPDGHSLVEILDEDTDEAITAPGRAGRVVLTDLKRRLMPVIRYPVGDRAQWQEPDRAANRKFLLLGRSEEGGRIGPVTMYYDDVREILQKFAAELHSFDFQLVLRHHGGKDHLVIRIATGFGQVPPPGLEDRLRACVYADRPMYRECLEQGKIGPVQFAWTAAPGLQVNARSGKLRRIIDERA